MTTVTREHKAGLELVLTELQSSLHRTQYDQLIGLIAQASAAPEQESVAWLLSVEGYKDVLVDNYQRALSEQEHFLGRGRTCVIRNLYTHADPSEVERLRAELAEAQALLQRGVLVGRSELSIVRAALKRDAEERGMPVRAEILADLDSSIERFDTLLSATAQPAECAHSNTAQHRTGDGTPVEFCNECGKNTHVGQPAEVKS